MGRFYNASANTPQFIDGMYTPPWELINSKLQENQQGYDNVLATTNLFNDIDIQHIEDPVVKEQAQKIKDYYTQKSEEITNSIKDDPMAWKKAMPNIQGLTRELQKDMKSGDISNMQQQYASLAKFAEDNKELKNTNPGLYNQALQYYLGKWQQDPLRKKSFDWNPIVKSIDQDKLNKDIQAIKASATEDVDNSGFYIVGNKSVPKDQIDAAARAYVYGRPENAAFLQQQVMFKDSNYYNEEYAKLHPDEQGNPGSGLYETLYRDMPSVDENGRPIQGAVLSDEQILARQKKYQDDLNSYYEKVRKKDKTAVAPTINWQTEHGTIGRMLQEAEAMGAYSEQTLKPNSVKTSIYVAQLHTQSSEKIAAARNAIETQKANIDIKFKALGSVQKQIELVNKAITDLNTTTLDKNNPDYKVKIDALEKQRGELLTSTASMLAVMGLSGEQVPESNLQGGGGTSQKTTTTTTTGKTEKQSNYPQSLAYNLLFDGQKLQESSLPTAKEEVKDKGTYTSLGLNIPQSWEALKNAPEGTRDAKLYSELMSQTKQEIQNKVSSNPVLKNYSSEFMEYYEKLLKNSQGKETNSSNIDEILNDFLEQHIKTKGMKITSTNGASFSDNYTAKEYVLGNKNFNSSNTYTPPRTTPQSKEEKEYIEVHKGILSLKKQLKSVIQPALLKGESTLKDYNQSKQYGLVPVDDWGSRNLLALIRDNKPAFVVKEVKEDGKLVDKNVDITTEEFGDMSSFKIETSIIGSVMNDNSNASFMRGPSGKKYIVYPSSNAGRNGSGKVVSAVKDLMMNEHYTTAQGENLRYWNRPENQAIEDIKSAFDVAPAIKNKTNTPQDLLVQAPGSKPESKTFSGGFNYSVPYSFKNKSGDDMPFRLLMKSIGGQTFYNAVPEGTTEPIFPGDGVSSIESMYTLINNRLKQ